MKINIQSLHARVGEKTLERVTAKFNRLSKLFDRIIQCDVTLKKENSDSKEDFMVEAKLAIPGNDLFAREKAYSYSTAAYRVYDDLASLIRKHKAKIRRKSKRSVDTFLSDSDEEAY